MFKSRSGFGFPHKAQKVISQYNSGAIRLDEAISMLTENWNTSIRQWNKIDGKKITSIEFGCPVVFSFDMVEEE